MKEWLKIEMDGVDYSLSGVSDVTGRESVRVRKLKTLKEWLKIEMDGVDYSLSGVTDDTGRESVRVGK